MGEAEQWLQKLEEHPDSLCVLFVPGQMEGSGACSSYPYRGLICRLFGFSSRINKYGYQEFVGCKPIKSEQPAAYSAVVEGVKAGNAVPVLSHHYMRLHSIDPELSRTRYPINEAIRRAIETVLLHFTYRGYTDFPEPGAA